MKQDSATFSGLLDVMFLDEARFAMIGELPSCCGAGLSQRRGDLSGSFVRQTILGLSSNVFGPDQQ
jgi:hypothetical protein